jgi:hypothetical protein
MVVSMAEFLKELSCLPIADRAELVEHARKLEARPGGDEEWELTRSPLYGKLCDANCWPGPDFYWRVDRRMWALWDNWYAEQRIDIERITRLLPPGSEDLTLGSAVAKEFERLQREVVELKAELVRVLGDRSGGGRRWS